MEPPKMYYNKEQFIKNGLEIKQKQKYKTKHSIQCRKP